MAALEELLGQSLQGVEGEPTPTSECLAEVSFVGLFFISQSAAEACGAFATTLTAACTKALKEKGLEVVVVATDDSEEDFDTISGDLPWPGVPFGSEERGKLKDRFEVAEYPTLIIIDAEGQVKTSAGVEKVTADPAGAGFPWAALTEDEIFLKLGPMPPGPGEVGLKGIFFNPPKLPEMGFTDQADPDDNIPFSGYNSRPYREFPKADIMEQLRKQGFYSDWHAHTKDLEKFSGDTILVMFDPERCYGEKFIWCTSQDAYEREKERIEDLRQKLLEEIENANAPGGGGEDGVGTVDEEADIVVRDLPKECQEWVSETMAATHEEVANHTIYNERPLMQVMITRYRSSFGKPCKFSDSGENLHGCRPHKDPNYALQRKELEIGIQAVKETRTTSCQTAWFRLVNKSTQYSPTDFLQRDVDFGYDQVDALSAFLSAVSDSVEEALQTNETVDIFQEEFAHLGDDDTSAISKSSSNIREYRNFHDVTYTKNKRIEWLEWVPNSPDMLASSTCENLPFHERLESAGKATQSTILVWSFQDSLAPHAVLLAPWEVPVFRFYPSDERYIVGGLSSGQLAVWKVSDADLGRAMRKKSQGIGGDEEKASSIPSVPHKLVSMIDESHRRAVVAIEWLPPTIEIERKGRGASEKHPKDGPVKYFLSIAGDGQIMIWDFLTMLESVNEPDFIWRPVHHVQLQRQDSGTEMGLCQILYCANLFDEKGNKCLTNFYASTEEGELIFGDWASRADGESDRKPEICKRMMNISKTFRPMLSMEHSPFFPDLLLVVTDFAFFLFKDGYDKHIFQSSYTSTYFTCGVWSPTRPSVIFLGLQSGAIDIWDFSDQSHKASLTDNGASVAISSMGFLKHGDMFVDQKLAVGDAGGNLRVHIIPKNLVKQAGKEVETMQRFLDREEERTRYFNKRRAELIALKEQKEKEEQMAADKEDAQDKTKAAADQEKADIQAEQAYQKLEQECREMLAGG